MKKRQHARDGQYNVFPSSRGGDTTTYGGYVFERCVGHPLQNIFGFVAQHRLLGETLAGRPLHKNEVVHHKDECRTNNSLGNLVVLTQTEHRRLHMAERAESAKIPLTEVQVERALREHGGIKPAARALLISHSTLRERFPALCLPYRRATPTKIDNPGDISEVLRLAADPAVGLREIAQRMKMSSRTVRRLCDRAGVPYVKQKRATLPDRAVHASPPEPGIPQPL